jgi:hypothetical protein
LKQGQALGLVIAGQKIALSRHAGSRPNKLLRSFCVGLPAQIKIPIDGFSIAAPTPCF